jgi:hypothetical protein
LAVTALSLSCNPQELLHQLQLSFLWAELALIHLCPDRCPLSEEEVYKVHVWILSALVCASHRLLGAARHLRIAGMLEFSGTVVERRLKLLPETLPLTLGRSASGGE